MIQGLQIAGNPAPLLLNPRMANRHGLVAGATGTGKSVTLRVLAEHFSRIGVPTFLADVKGDLGGIARPATPNKHIDERVDKLSLTDYSPEGFPVVFWDVFGEGGHPVRSTISEMGPLLLARLLELNDTQTATLQVLFKIADEQGLLLLDLKDLIALLRHVSEHSKELQGEYGNLHSGTLGAIQRGLTAFESAGGEPFFGEPALRLDDLLRPASDGRGYVHILNAAKLFHSPHIYATTLLWLLSELFEQLPEVGDQEKPRLVFFFDEAHLLFRDLPKQMQDKVEQIIRLIRSKGVGVFFVTQSPMDVPDQILGQLGNRIQHALRAYTPKDQRTIQGTADTFRRNPDLDVAATLTSLGVGEALISFLDEKGTPGVVQRGLVCPPRSLLGASDPNVIREVRAASPFGTFYDKVLDRDSAYEELKRQAEREAKEAEKNAEEPKSKAAPKRRGDSPTTAFIKSTLRTVGTALGREIVRGIMGSITGRRRR
ncbi:MAG: helicase HerA-like domain-containing protein [Chthoniobacterales bacterium]